MEAFSPWGMPEKMNSGATSGLASLMVRAASRMSSQLPGSQSSGSPASANTPLWFQMPRVSAWVGLAYIYPLSAVTATWASSTDTHLCYQVEVSTLHVDMYTDTLYAAW